MTLISTGPISLSDIQTEFGGSAPTSIVEYYRNGAYVTANNTLIPTSGLVSLSNFYTGVRAFVFAPTVGGVNNYNLYAAAIAAGWNGLIPLLATITISGVVGSSSTSSPAFSESGTYPAGSAMSLIITSGSYIVGAGGLGGGGSSGALTGGGAGGAGGLALQLAGVNLAKTISNSGTIAGGGGGGGGGGWNAVYFGSGGGGGAGTVAGAGGAPGFSGWPGTVAGSVGTLTSGGASGGGITGGAGGGLGTAGGIGATSGGTGGGAGGAAGAATSGQASATWTVAGTRLGTLG